MLYREIIAVCSQIHTKHINTLCGYNVELLNVKPGRILNSSAYRAVQTWHCGNCGGLPPDTNVHVQPFTDCFTVSGPLQWGSKLALFPSLFPHLNVISTAWNLRTYGRIPFCCTDWKWYSEGWFFPIWLDLQCALCLRVACAFRMATVM
jgi:hypothetical protein